MVISFVLLNISISKMDIFKKLHDQNSLHFSAPSLNFPPGSYLVLFLQLPERAGLLYWSKAHVPSLVLGSPSLESCFIHCLCLSSTFYSPLPLDLSLSISLCFRFFYLKELQPSSTSALPLFPLLFTPK